MRLIHCADLHLDSQLETHLSARQAAERNMELSENFVALARYARERQVAAILIAGDLFDTERASRRTVELVLSTIRDTPEVDFFYLKGNHDEDAAAFDDDDRPANLKLFCEDWRSYRCGDAVITGAELTDQNALTIYDALRLEPEAFNIVLLHGQVGSAGGADRVNLNLLRDRNIDYLALGHIHGQTLQTLDSRGKYCYPGCLEGRGFDECGPKGFMLLELTGGRLRTEFVPFARRVLHEVPVSVEGLRSNTELYKAMGRAAENIPASAMVKFVLTGKYELGASFDADYLARLARDDFYFVRVKDESALRIDPESYANDVSLKGEYIRLVLAAEPEEELRSALIRVGLAALSGEEITV